MSLLHTFTYCFPFPGTTRKLGPLAHLQVSGWPNCWMRAPRRVWSARGRARAGACRDLVMPLGYEEAGQLSWGRLFFRMMMRRMMRISFSVSKCNAVSNYSTFVPMSWVLSVLFCTSAADGCQASKTQHPVSCCCVLQQPVEPLMMMTR